MIPFYTPDCGRTTFSRTGNPVMCPCCRSRKSRAKPKAERLEGGAAAALPPRRAAPRRGGDPEVRLLRQAFLQQESALVKMREVLARLEGRDEPPAEEPAAAGAGAQELPRGAPPPPPPSYFPPREAWFD